MSRFSSSAGIAIGPILFVLALLAIIATVMASGSGSMSSAITADSITPVLVEQAHLIRGKMQECNTISDDSAIWPTNAASATSGAIADVECTGYPTGQQNLWTGAHPATLPPPPTNFSGWTYFDHHGTGGGRCIRIAPTNTTIAAESAIKQGIRTAYDRKFTSLEAAYDSGGANQYFIIWITRPTGAADADCTAG